MRIICAGLATVDLVYRVPAIPGPDRKAQATAMEVAAGGPAANAAVTAAALGADVTLVTAIGAHPLGALIHDDLRGYGVRVIDAAAGSDAPPPVSAITVAEGTGARSIVSRNAGTRIHAAPDADYAAADAILVDGHHPALCRAAARAGRPLVVDAGSWRPIFTEVFPLATVVACAATFRPPGATRGGPPAEPAGREMRAEPAGCEMRAATDGAQPHKSGMEGAGGAGSAQSETGGRATADAVVSALRAMGVRNGAITDGPAPIVWWAGGPAESARAGRAGQRSGRLAVPPVAAVDTAGAGMPFTGRSPLRSLGTPASPTRSGRCGSRLPWPGSGWSMPDRGGGFPTHD